jgi:hypothetical protein
MCWSYNTLPVTERQEQMFSVGKWSLISFCAHVVDDRYLKKCEREGISIAENAPEMETQDLLIMCKLLFDKGNGTSMRDRCTCVAVAIIWSDQWGRIFIDVGDQEIWSRVDVPSFNSS